MIRFVLVALVLLLASGACEPRRGQAEGVLVHVDSAGLDAVESFTLRTNDGRQLEFEVGVLENEAEFPQGHLAEHLAGSEPIRVFYREEGGRRVVYRLEDAGT